MQPVFRALEIAATTLVKTSGTTIIPLIVWGAHRVWTKDHPRASLLRNKIPITVAVGPAVTPAGDAAALGTALRAEMELLLQRAQRDYPHPAGAYWVPQRMGGSAPTPAEAKVLDDEELAERARRRAPGGR